MRDSPAHPPSNIECARESLAHLDYLEILEDLEILDNLDHRSARTPPPRRIHPMPPSNPSFLIPHLSHLQIKPIFDILFAKTKGKSMEEQVKAKLEELRVALQADGGDLELDHFEGKTVFLKLVGHCGTCPFAMMTLKNGIEAALREIDPEITVERVMI